MSRVLFVSENIGGHATMHRHIRSALERDRPDVQAEFIEAEPRSAMRRVAGAAVPGLGRLDLDLASLRGQLAASVHLRRRLPRLEEYDALHVYTHHAAIAWADELRRLPSIVSLDATGAQTSVLLPYRRPTRYTKLSSSPARRLEARVYDRAAVVVAKSQWAAASLADDYGLDPARVRVIPYGITLPAGRAGERRQPPPEPTVVFVGRSMERKGGWRLLSLWRRYLRDRCRLLLITPEHVPPEPGVEVLRSLAPGDMAMFDALAGASVMAFPSEMDTFGYAPIEAMAVGVPVVAYAQGATPEVVRDGETGTLVPPGDEESFANALAALLEDHAMRDRMGDAGVRWVRQRFDASVTTAALVTLMEEVVHGRTRTGSGVR
jgi:glycosyltransferase involved in cell wall biosynthesis